MVDVCYFCGRADAPPTWVVPIVQQCGNCAHANHDESPNDVLTLCAKINGYFNGKLMPRSARCERWEATS